MSGIAHGVAFGGAVFVSEVPLGTETTIGGECLYTREPRLRFPITVPFGGGSMALTVHRAGRIAVSIAILALMIAGAALAQDEAAPLKIATVSINQIQAKYGELQSQQQVLEAWLAEQRRFTNMLLDYVFLATDNFEEATGLLKKQQRTQEEQDRLMQLQGVSDEKDKRFRELEANATRTLQEQDEYNSLQDTYRARAKTIDDLWQATLAQLNERRQTAISGLMGKVSEAIKAEAEAQGFYMVVDADAVMYGGIDITEQVLVRLNGGAAPAATGGAEGGTGGGQ